MFQKNKRGDAPPPSSPATIFGIITLLVVMYVILIPPSFREELLNGNSTDYNDNGVEDNYYIQLLEEEPGYWSYMSYDNYDHDIPSFNLLSKTEAAEIFLSSHVASKYTAFSKKTGSFDFDLSNLATMDNFYLNYKISSQNGLVYVSVNGNVVDEITSGTREDVVSINRNYLQVGKNTVEFIPESVGFAFWKYNSIVVDQAKIFADITDYSNMQNIQNIWISQDEYDNLEDADLRFFVDCEVAAVGKVDISINGNRIFSGVPDCGILNVVDHINPSLLEEGDNTITFKAAEGRFIFDTLNLQTNLKESVYPTYFFDVDEDDAYIIETFTDDVDVNLTFTFVNDEDYKELQAVLNGHTISINTRDRVYTVEINHMDIVEGKNVLELRPKDSMNIVKVNLFAAESN